MAQLDMHAYKHGDELKTRIGVTDYFENWPKNKDKGLINDGIAPFMSNIDGIMYDLEATVLEYTWAPLTSKMCALGFFKHV